MNQFIFEFILIGIVGGLLGVFYRNCLKVEDMIFHWWYVILQKWVKESKAYYRNGVGHRPNLFGKLMGFIAYPLGFCIYCSTTWITFFLCILWLINSESLPDWNLIVVGIVAATGVQHLVVCCACRFLIHNHPDLDN